MKTKIDLSNLNSDGRKRYKLQRKHPYGRILSLSLSLALALGLAGCALVDGGEQATTSTTPSSSQAGEQLAGQEQGEEVASSSAAEEVDDFTLLIDKLDITGLHMVDNLTPKIEEEVQKQLSALVPEGGTVIDSSDVYVAPDGSTWVSEQDYLNYINNQQTPSTPSVEETGTGENVQDGYLAPDGSVWVSEEEYLKYVNSQTTGETGSGTTEEVVVEENYYLAPDGSVWESEEAYLKYINDQASNGGATGDDTVVEVEDDNLYKAPDGTYWESEQAYLDSLNADVIEEPTAPEQGETGKGDESTEDYYLAPDGTRWESEEMYDEYIKGQEAVAEEIVVGDSTITEDTTVTENTSTSEFYMSPDGELWVSEEAYLASLGTTSATDTGMGTEEEVVTSEGVEVVPESQYQEPAEEEQVIDTSNYYVDEDGNYWASYEDYLIYMQYIAQEENGKQK